MPARKGQRSVSCDVGRVGQATALRLDLALTCIFCCTAPLYTHTSGIVPCSHLCPVDAPTPGSSNQAPPVKVRCRSARRALHRSNTDYGLTFPRSALVLFSPAAILLLVLKLRRDG
jgi:hypothetical protein